MGRRRLDDTYNTLICNNLYVGNKAVVRKMSDIAAAEEKESINCIELSHSVTLDRDLTIDNQLNIPNGAIITLGEYDLVINGAFSAGPYQCFNCNSSGTVTFAAGSVKEVYPEWWGAKGDGATDDTEALQAALNSNAPIMKLGTAAYCSGELNIPTTGIKIIGLNRSSSVVESLGGDGTWLFTYNDATKTWRGGGIERLTIAIPNTGSNGIKLLESRGFTIQDINLSGTGGGAIGILLDDEASTYPQQGTAWNKIDNYFIENFSVAGIRLNTSGTSVWCNRNYIGFGHVYNCGIGFDIIKGDTNFIIGGCPQDCTTGFNLGSGADYCQIHTTIEGCTNDIILDAGAVRNTIIGYWDNAKVTGTGSNTTFIRSGIFNIPSINSNLGFETSENNREIGLLPGSTGNLLFSVRNSSDSASYVMALVGNVELPYLLIYKSAVLGSNTSEPATKITGMIVRADRTNWDPLSKGSGGSYLVWWNGSAWKNLIEQ